MLMALGLFVFDLGSAPYDELQRRAAWNHAKAPRFGDRPATQFTGPGDETINLAGKIAPLAFGSYAALETLRAMADTGEAWPLVDGTGKVFGSYIIESIDVRQRHLLDNGVPRIADFGIDLYRIG